MAFGRNWKSNEPLDLADWKMRMGWDGCCIDTQRERSIRQHTFCAFERMDVDFCFSPGEYFEYDFRFGMAESVFCVYSLYKPMKQGK